MSLSDYLFSPHGRLNRAKYWLYLVGSAAILIIFFAIISLVFSRQLYDPRGGFAFPPGVLVGIGVIYIVLLIVGIFVGIKRLHDRDKSGWWLLLFIWCRWCWAGFRRSCRATGSASCSRSPASPFGFGRWSSLAACAAPPARTATARTRWRVRNPSPKGEGVTINNDNRRS